MGECVVVTTAFCIRNLGIHRFRYLGILEPFTHGYRGTVVQINGIFLTYTILRKHFYLKNKLLRKSLSDSQTWA